MNDTKTEYKQHIHYLKGNFQINNKLAFQPLSTKKKPLCFEDIENKPHLKASRRYLLFFPPVNLVKVLDISNFLLNKILSIYTKDLAAGGKGMMLTRKITN